jgi:hypothetical protein
MPTRKRAGPQGDHFSSFDRSPECLKGVTGFPVKTKRVRLDFPFAPTPGTDSGARCRNHPSSRQLERHLGTDKQLG